MTMAWKQAIRRALEEPLKLAAAGASIPVAWPNYSPQFAPEQEHLQVSFHFGPSIPKTLGQTPRVEIAGFMLIGVRTPSGTGQDRNDDLAGIVEAAYAYATDLVFAGITVKIDATDAGDAVPDPPWFYAPVKVNWNCWRST